MVYLTEKKKKGIFSKKVSVRKNKDSSSEDLFEDRKFVLLFSFSFHLSVRPSVCLYARNGLFSARCLCSHFRASCAIGGPLV